MIRVRSLTLSNPGTFVTISRIGYLVLDIFVIFELEGERKGGVVVEGVVEGVYQLSDPIGTA